MSIQIYTQRTPNPKSLKFIVNRDVVKEGKAVFTSISDCGEVVLAKDLMSLPHVTQIYFFENMITVTQSTDEWDELQLQIRSVIQTRLPAHNPEILKKGETVIDRSQLSPELAKIEEILDRTIRPGLKSDGGDLDVVKLENNELTVRYQGACGTCPSSTSGTLYAIEDILRREYHPELKVYPE